MRTEAPEGGHAVRPPASKAVVPKGASVRRTAMSRPLVPVRLLESPGDVEVTDPYVRRYWVAAIGPEAVTELLRLVRAAQVGETVRMPRYLPLLLRTRLVKADSGGLLVSSRIPFVPAEMRWRFTPPLARQHADWILTASSTARP